MKAENQIQLQEPSWQKIAANTAIGLCMLLALFIISRQNYLLFHVFVEFFSIAVAFALFIVVWNSRHFAGETALVFLGIAYLFIGGIDLLHTIVYKGMGVISDTWGANPATQLWIAGRYMESVSLCLFAVFWKKRFRPHETLIVYSLVTATILLSVFYWRNFPDCFVEGIGLTGFKKISEYVIICILAVALTLIVKKKHDFNATFYQLMISSIVLTIVAESAFTFYVSVYGLSNLIGHYFKIISFFLIYLALVRSNLREPYRVLFLDLVRERQLLNESKALLDTTNRMAKIGGWELDVPTLGVTWTEGTFRIHEVPPDYKPALRDAIHFFHPEDRPQLEKAIQQALDHGEPYDMEIRFITAKGRELWTRTYCEPEMTDGKVVRLKGTFQDITELKQAEEKIQEYSHHLQDLVEERTRELKEAQEQLIRKEKLAVLGQLAGGVGHELRNPLGAIKNAAYFLNMIHEHPDGEIRDTLELMTREVAAAEKIIQSLFDYADPKRPALKFGVSLNDQIQQVLSYLDIPSDIEIQRELNEPLPAVNGDLDQLEQVFRNLLRNAAQAMREGGTLTVRTGVLKDGRVEVRISDTGEGISKENLDKVFEPLFTTKAKGIGLGLALCRSHVEAHGGTLEVESEEGKGTTFTVRFPLRSVQEAENEEALSKVHG